VCAPTKNNPAKIAAKASTTHLPENHRKLIEHLHARERVASMGLDQRVEIRRRDYRGNSGEAHFDKIVSVGMYKHVGIANLPLYFSTIARLSRSDGIMASPQPTGTAMRRARPAASSSTGWCFRAARWRIFRAYFTRLPESGSKSSMSRICIRITR
jgi:hypothetical protein